MNMIIHAQNVLLAIIENDFTYLVCYLIETAVFPCQEYSAPGGPNGPQHTDIVRREVKKGGGLEVHFTMGVSGEG